MSKKFNHKIRYDETSPKKEKEFICHACYNMPWRVEGTNCSYCRLGYAPEVITQETCGVELMRTSSYRDNFEFSSGVKSYFQGVLRGNTKSPKGGKQ